MSSFKAVYSFTVEQEKEFEEIVKEIRDGQEVEVKVKKKKKVPVEVAIKKPNRAILDRAELFYGVSIAEGVKAGLLPASLLAKRFDDDGGALSGTVVSSYYNNLFKARELENELTRLSLKNDKTEVDNKKLEASLGELSEIRESLRGFKIQESSLYENTAEARARKQTILWYILYLSYWKNGTQDFEAIYKGDLYKDKLSEYEKLEDEEDDFYIKVANKLAAFIAFYYYSGDGKRESFEVFEKEIDGDPSEGIPSQEVKSNI